MLDASRARSVTKARAVRARDWVRALAWALAMAIPLAGCGLKGSLTLPEKSKNVVIRPGPGGETPTTTPPEAETEPLPPPELPPDTRGNTRA